MNKVLAKITLMLDDIEVSNCVSVLYTVRVATLIILAGVTYFQKGTTYD